MWDDIPDDVKAELQDPEFLGRQHFSRATYRDGCHGPLCRYRERLNGRRKNERKAQKAGREYNPSHETRKTQRDALLTRIIVWHLSELHRLKAERHAETILPNDSLEMSA